MGLYLGRGFLGLACGSGLGVRLRLGGCVRGLGCGDKGGGSFRGCRIFGFWLWLMRRDWQDKIRMFWRIYAS